MKRRILAVFTALLLVGLCGCRGGQKDDATTTAENSTTRALTPLTFTGFALRTDGYHEDADYPSVAIINSVSDLQKYYTANKDRYFLERRTPVPPNTAQGFLDAAERYDDAFFTAYTLVLILIEEGSGSVRHEVTKVVQNNAVTQITIRRDVPEIGTADMAEWHVFVELSNTEYNGSGIEVQFETGKLGQPTGS